MCTLHDAPAGSEARAVCSIDAMRNDASTSLRGWAGASPFFPFGILCYRDLHRDITDALADVAGGGEVTFESGHPKPSVSTVQCRMRGRLTGRATAPRPKKNARVPPRIVSRLIDL